MKLSSGALWDIRGMPVMSPAGDSVFAFTPLFYSLATGVAALVGRWPIDGSATAIFGLVGRAVASGLDRASDPDTNLPTTNPPALNAPTWNEIDGYIGDVHPPGGRFSAYSIRASAARCRPPSSLRQSAPVS